MLSYKEYVDLILNEGIIRVDEKVLDFLIATFMLHYNKKVDKEILNFNKFKSTHDNFVRDNNIKVEGKRYFNVPYTHDNFKGTFNYYIDSKCMNSDIGAYFSRKTTGNHKLNSIHVCFDDKLIEDTNKWLNGEVQLDTIIRDKRTQLEHELVHLVEVLIGDDIKKHKKFKKNYDSGEDDYYTSEIEFEPMVVSSIRDFVNEIKKHVEQTGKPISKDTYELLVREYLVGEVVSTLDNLFIFKHKRISPSKYKKVVNKIYVELMGNLGDLIKNNIVEG